VARAVSPDVPDVVSDFEGDGPLDEH
jgi:hypothetical protein